MELVKCCENCCNMGYELDVDGTLPINSCWCDLWDTETSIDSYCASWEGLDAEVQDMV